MTTRTTQHQPPPTTTTRELELTAIDVGDQNLRELQFDDGIAELAADINRHGLLQPIGVRSTTTGRYQLLWGLRRLRAHAHLNRTTITARIYDNSTDDLVALALVENVHRHNLTLKEECDAVCRLHEAGRSPSQICALLSKSRAWVLRRLAIPNLPADLVDPALNSALPLSSIESLARCTDPAGRACILSAAINGNWNTEQVKAAADTWEANAAAYNNPELPVQGAPPPVPVPQHHRRCSACSEIRKVEDLTMVEICADGCSRAHTQPDPEARH